MSYIIQAFTANGIGIVLLLSLIVNFRRKFKSGKSETKAFLFMLLVNIYQCVAEPLTIIIDGKLFPGARVISLILNSSLYIGCVLFSTLWMLYSDLHANKNRKISKRARILRFVPTYVVILASLINLFVPVFFKITEANVYERTFFFPFSYIVTYVYLVIGTLLAYGFLARDEHRYVFLPAFTFLTPVVIASILQYVFQGYSFLWVGAAIGMASAYISLLDEGTSIDPLTGTYSRQYFNHYMSGVQAQVRGGATFVGLMMDVDNFKLINDRFGHIAGDDALKEVGRILRKIAIARGGLAFRYGGDEFTMIFKLKSEKLIFEIINDIKAELEATNAKDENLVYGLHLSYGYASYLPDEKPAEFLERMDAAMYDHKKIKMLKITSKMPKIAATYDVNPDRNCILIVDDDFINRTVMKNIFPPQYRVEEAENGRDGLARVDELYDSLCAILLDIDMPEINGIDMLRMLNERGITNKLPVFMITANDEYNVARESYELGAMDVINKPVVPFVILRRMQSVLELFHAREDLQSKVQGQERQLRENADTIDELHKNTIQALASAIEFRDIESGEHINRIYDITKCILMETSMGDGFTNEEIEGMAIGSIMHDVGKIAISDVILNKPGKLTEEEYNTVKTHTVKGADLLAEISKTQNHPAYKYAEDIARHHHERWDGRGYPDGLRGDEITIWSQVVSIADVYDALLSPRVYKKAIEPDAAVSMIINGECGVFNPELVEAFLTVEPKMRRWYSDGEFTKASADTKRTSVPGKHREPTDAVSIMHLIDAIKSAYDMIISVNLTQNTYVMIDHENFYSHRDNTDGVFDELMISARELIPQTHRDAFYGTFSRQALLRSFTNGKKTVSLEYPEYSDDGTVRQVSTTVIFQEDYRNGDVLEFTLTKYV